MVSDPNQAGPQNPQAQDAALGFTSEPTPKDEKYDTRFLVANMKRNERTPKLIILSAVAAIVLALAMYAALKEPSPEPAAGTPVMLAPSMMKAPAAAPAAATPKPAEKPAEAPKP